MKIICASILVITICMGCQTAENVAPSEAIENFSINLPSLYVEDRNAVDSDFLRLLISVKHPDSIRLMPPFMIVGTDTFLPPLSNSIADSLLFSEKEYKLSIYPEKWGAVRYVAQVKNDKQPAVIFSGKALLNPLFFLAAEIIDHPETGESIGLVQYQSKLKNGELTLMLSSSETDQNLPYAAFRVQFFDRRGIPAYFSPLLTRRQ